jgi:short-subunit dehydrogenase
MDLKLKDKTAFISGSTSGIGYAVAKILLREGMSVYINGRSQNSVDTAISQLKNEVIDASVFGIVADFNQPSQISKIFKTLSEVNVLINNVGIYSSSSFFATSVETWQEQFQVNVMSGVSLSKYYMKKMLHQNWGRILFISS